MRSALLATLLATLLPVTAFGAGPVVGPDKCAAQWVAPTTNTDATTLTDLKEYTIYISATKGQFTTPTSILTVANPAPAPNTVVTWDCRTVGLTAGQKWLTVRARDLATNESANGAPDASAVADGATVVDGVPFVYDPLKPAAPSGLRLAP